MKKEQLELSNRIGAVIDRLNNGMYEREEIIAVALLAALAGESAFLLGPPGTAKSLIARRIACAFDDKIFFSYLMNKFSTPEEVFGPISIKELKEDKYVRKTEHFLPMADFAFLDEIWKAGPAILNTLLTIINERIFRNGTEEQKVPLKALIAASNETPPEGQGLEALYDRFIVRLYVPPMQKNENFEKLLNAEPTLADIKIAEELSITNKEWDEWRGLIQAVDLSPETIQVVKLIKADLIEKNKEKGKEQFYVSDRRWQKAMALVKAAAFFCGRDKTNLADTLLLRHCLWTSEGNRAEVMQVVKKAVKSSSIKTEKDINGLITKKNELEQEIQTELFHSEDIYDTVKIGGKEYFKVNYVIGTIYEKNTTVFNCSGTNEKHDDECIFYFYIPCDKYRAQGEFPPLCYNREIEKEKDFLPKIPEKNDTNIFSCKFKGRGTFLLKMTAFEAQCSHCFRRNKWHMISYNSFINSKREYSNTFTDTLKIKFPKGTKKTNVKCLQKNLQKITSKITEEFTSAQMEVEEQLEQLRSELKTPFVPESVCDIAVESIEKQLEEIGIAIQDCERLRDIVKSRE